MFSSASDKTKLFAENCSRNSSDSGISLSVLPSRTNLKPHNISVTPKLVKKVYLEMLRKGVRLKTVTMLVCCLCLVKS